MTKRVDKAVEEASEAFWAVIAKSFPEAKTGDLDPLADLAFSMNTREIVGQWVVANVPGKVKVSGQ